MRVKKYITGRIKNLSLVLMALCLFFNLAGDLYIFSNQSQEQQATQRLNQIFELMHAEYNLREELIAKRDNPKYKDKTEEHLKLVSGFAPHVPELSQAIGELNHLKSSQLTGPGRNDALKLLDQMSFIQNTLIRQHMERSSQTTNKNILSAVVENSVDLALIILSVMIFIIEKRAAAKAKKDLEKALDRVEQLNQDLEISMASKDTIFKTAVHDLKNPISSIVGLSELLAEDLDQHPHAQKISKIIHDVSNETLSLVDYALKSESETNSSAGEKVDVIQIIEETCSLLTATLDKKLQRISVANEASGSTIVGNPRDIQRILFNIIGNASKFSPQGSSIFVKISNDELGCRVKVIDQGPGFKAADFDQLFTKGMSLSAKPTGTEISTGYGLFSVKRQLESMHGKIEVKNNHGPGATIEILFLAEGTLAA